MISMAAAMFIAILWPKPTSAEAPGAMAQPGFSHKLDMNMAAAFEIIAQDLHVDAKVQEGLRSRFAARGRYSWQEGAQGQFNRWMVPRYQRTWAEMNGKAASPQSAAAE